MSSASLRITIPPSRVRDLDRLLALQRHGFLPSNMVHFDRDEHAFVIELDGDAVSHVLELLEISMDTRDAETWDERKAREHQQLPLSLADQPDQRPDSRGWRSRSFDGHEVTG